MLKKDYFKKNLLRVKQMADQNLGRAEKTEVLSEDLVSAEKRVELIKQACHNSSKKIAFLVQGPGTDAEKRRKKIPESSLAVTMAEASTLLGEGLLGQILQMCCDAEGSLGEQRLEHEMAIESSVMSPLQNLLDNEIPSLIKLKKQLSRFTLDMDSAKARWHSAVRQTAGSSNMVQMSAKADTIKEEYDDALARVEQCKDQYTTDLYNFLSREPEVAERYIELAQSQANYHRHALESLEAIIPKMREEIQKYSMKPVYGTPLEDHLQVTEREIAFVIEECICTLLQIGMEEEGLFRIAGSASKLKKLKAAFDAGAVDMADFVTDVPAIAGALKLYLRELPEPLLTFSLYSDWMQAAQIQDKNQRLQALWVVLDKLPSPNYKNLRYLIKFLSKLTDHSDTTKMTASNLGIVIGPNLLWSSREIDGHSVVSTSIQSAIVESMIQHAAWFFPGDIDFGELADTPTSEVTPPPTESHSRNNSTGGNIPQPSPPAVNVASALETEAPTPSPKAPRRTTKKIAPRPPVMPALIPERENIQAPPIPEREGQPQQLPNATSPMDKIPPPTPPARSTSLPPSAEPEAEPCQSPRSKTLERPSAPPPERPSAPPPERPHTICSTDPVHNPERPHGPPPERPHGPPPERPQVPAPEKPSSVSSDRPVVPDRPSAPPPERPDIGGKPIESKRPSANKPPRPQPPPPPSDKERSNSVTNDTPL